MTGPLKRLVVLVSSCRNILNYLTKEEKHQGGNSKLEKNKDAKRALNVVFFLQVRGPQTRAILPEDGSKRASDHDVSHVT